MSQISLANKKLLLIGPSAGSVHLKRYSDLIGKDFSEVFVVTESSKHFNEPLLVNFSLKNPFEFWKNVKKLKRFISKKKPDVIHVHQANSCLLLAVLANKKTKLPLICTAWGSDVLVLPKRSKVLKKLLKYSLSRTDLLTADADYMIDAVKLYSKNLKCVNANFGISRSKVEKDPKKEKIVYSNRLHFPLYRIGDIIDGFADFSKEHSDWKLVIGAKGELTAELREKAKERLRPDQFEFIGFVDEKTNLEFYQKSKIWISYPLSDGTSISMLEAMDNGCVPVVTDLPANSEWVQHHENGILIREDVGEALRLAVQLNGEVVAKYNKKIIDERGSKEVNRDKFLSCYLQVLGTSN